VSPPPCAAARRCRARRTVERRYWAAARALDVDLLALAHHVQRLLASHAQTVPVRVTACAPDCTGSPQHTLARHSTFAEARVLRLMRARACATALAAEACDAVGCALLHALIEALSARTDGCARAAPHGRLRRSKRGSF
jgi:hypothetical protein